MTKSTGSMTQMDNGWLVEFIFEHLPRYGEMPPTDKPKVFQRVYVGENARENAARALAELFMTEQEEKIDEATLFQFPTEGRVS